MKAWLPPKNYERRYRRFLRNKVDDVKREFLRRLGHIIKLQNKIKYEPEPEELKWENADNDVKKNSDQIAFLIAGLSAWWLLQKPAIRTTIRGYYSGINLHNDKQLLTVVKDITGLALQPTRTTPYKPGQTYSPLSDLLNRLGDNADVYRQEPYLQGIEDNWVATQETYLDKTVAQVIGDSELSVRNGIVTAATTSVIVTAINSIFGTSDKRVNNFAENQVNSLNTQLTENRQRSLGADEYIWKTQRDERVRGNPNGLYPKAKPSHYHREGKIFSWKNPPEGGHPGEAPGCRCIALFRLPR